MNGHMTQTYTRRLRVRQENDIKLYSIIIVQDGIGLKHFNLPCYNKQCNKLKHDRQVSSEKTEIWSPESDEVECQEVVQCCRYH